MAIHHQNPLLVTKKQKSGHILQLVHKRQIDELLDVLVEMPGINKKRILAPIYPKISGFIRRHWFSHVANHPDKATINMIMTSASVNYINHIGCNCGKEINQMYLADEIVQHMSCMRFLKNILSFLPVTLRKQHIFYLNPSYRELLKKQYKSQFHIIDKIIHKKEKTNKIIC